MKKLILTSLIVALLLPMVSAFAVNVGAEMPSADALGGYQNVCLTYTFRTSNGDYGRHYKEDLMPYVAYLDKDGNVKDFFFDSYLFLPCMDFGPSGARMHVDTSNPTKAIDWTTYIEDTFYDGANVDALEEAYGEAKYALGDTDSKAGVFFTILYPCANANDFGELGGRQLDFSDMEDRKYAVKWMIDEQVRRYNDAGYQNLELVGFYWLEEFVVEHSDTELLQYTADYLHSLDMKFIWIPWYCANGYNRWKELGFDVACMQPNMFWMGNCDPYRVEESAGISENYGMGMEIEIDSRVETDDYFDRYLYYLEGGMRTGMMNTIKMYYQDGKPAVYYQAYHSNNERYRIVYDLTYKYAKGTLTQEDIDNNRPEGVNDNYVDEIDMSEIVHSGTEWISIGKTYTGCHSYVDGNGMGYQNVSGKELTDGIIATEAVNTDWHAFHSSIRDSEGRLSVTIDLGEVRNDITDFVAHFDNRQQYGIGSPSDVRVYISNDGVNFRLLTTPKMIFDRENSCFNYQCEPVTARYVKLSLLNSAPFVFCSEFLVGTSVEGDIPLEESNEVSKPEQSVLDDSGEEKNTVEDDTVKPIAIIMVVIVVLGVIAVIVFVILKKRSEKCN